MPRFFCILESSESMPGASTEATDNREIGKLILFVVI